MKVDPAGYVLLFAVLGTTALLAALSRRGVEHTVTVSAPSVSPAVVGLEYTIIPLGTCGGIGVCDEHDSCIGHEPKRPGIYVLAEERVVSGGDGIALACGWKKQ